MISYKARMGSYNSCFVCIKPLRKTNIFAMLNTINSYSITMKLKILLFISSVALLFQPFLKIALDRLTWNIIDVILAGLIVFTVFSLNKELK